MHYDGAKKCFVENRNLVGIQPMNDPQNWNLNNGLNQFVEAVQSDLAQVNYKLDRILRALQQQP
jgi:hypothetical protein